MSINNLELLIGLKKKDFLVETVQSEILVLKVIFAQ